MLINRTDSTLRIDVQQIIEIPITEEQWQAAVSIALDDIYANYICLGKDASYQYFVNATARSIHLLMRAGKYLEKKTG